MKYAFLMVFSLIISSYIGDESKGIQFEKISVEEALTKAEKERKGVFIVFMAPWCGACHSIKRNVFPSEELAKVYQKKFICVKYNKDKTSIPNILGDVTYNTLPAFFYLNSKGEVIKQIEGLHWADELIEIANDLEI